MRHYALGPMSGVRWTALLSLLAACAAAEAQPVVFTAPARDQVLEAGSAVEVAWSALPRDVDEVEILLSLDGGARRQLRLTEQLHAGSRSYSWRVPNLSAPRAVLVLRMGVGGREIESPPSAPFEIVGDRSVPATRFALLAGELWIAKNDSPRTAASLPPADFAPERERWTPAAARADSLNAPPAPGALMPPRGRREPASASPVPPRPLSVAFAPPAARLVALRI